MKSSPTDEALFDPVTGLADPELQRAHLRLALRRARRARSHVGVLFIDVEDAAGLDRRWGRGIGDKAIRALAERVHAAFRDTDVAARLEGDELVVVCEGLDDPGDIGLLARRVHELLAEPFEVDGVVVELRGSVGSAVSPGDDWPGRVLNSADRSAEADPRAVDRA